MASLSVKYGAWQVDGVEYATPIERTPNAEDIAFADAGTTITAADLQAAVAFLAKRLQFSFRIVDAGVIISVAYEQQMLAQQEIMINDTGELSIDGEVIIL